MTNALLHLRDGPAVTARDAKVARVPDEFGWIHSYDVSRVLRQTRCRRESEDGMGQDDMLAALTEILADVTGVDPAYVTPEARFDDLGIDPLTMVDVFGAVEDRFGLVIPDDEWARFEKARDAASHVQRAAGLPR